MALTYNPADWYWCVAGSTTEVWSSARWQYVPITDATYVAWQAAGGMTTNILNAAELYQVLQQQCAPLAQGAGVAVVSTGTPAISATYPIDPVAQAQMSAIAAGLAAGRGLPGGGATFLYPDINHAQRSFTSANFLAMASAIEGFLYQFNQAVATLVAGGAASLPTQPLTIP